MSDPGHSFVQALTPAAPQPRPEMMAAFTALAIALGCPLLMLDMVWENLQLKHHVFNTPYELQAQVRQVMRDLGMVC